MRLVWGAGRFQILICLTSGFQNWKFLASTQVLPDAPQMPPDAPKCFQTSILETSGGHTWAKIEPKWLHIYICVGFQLILVHFVRAPLLGFPNIWIDFDFLQGLPLAIDFNWFSLILQGVTLANNKQKINIPWVYKGGPLLNVHIYIYIYIYAYSISIVVCAACKGPPLRSPQDLNWFWLFARATPCNRT